MKIALFLSLSLSLSLSFHRFVTIFIVNVARVKPFIRNVSIAIRVSGGGGTSCSNKITFRFFRGWRQKGQGSEDGEKNIALSTAENASLRGPLSHHGGVLLFCEHGRSTTEWHRDDRCGTKSNSKAKTAAARKGGKTNAPINSIFSQRLFRQASVLPLALDFSGFLSSMRVCECRTSAGREESDRSSSCAREKTRSDFFISSRRRQMRHASLLLPLPSESPCSLTLFSCHATLRHISTLTGRHGREIVEQRPLPRRTTAVVIAAALQSSRRRGSRRPPPHLAAAAAAPGSQAALESAPTRADADALLNGDVDVEDEDLDEVAEAAEAEAVASYVAFLNSEFGIPGLVEASASPLDGAPQLTLRHPPTGFEATVSLHGAVVTSLVRPGVGELLYLEDGRGNVVRQAGDEANEERRGGGNRRRPLAFGVAPAFPMVGRSDGIASSAGAAWAQLPPDGILRHAHWSVAASGAATVEKRRWEQEGDEGEGGGAAAAVAEEKGKGEAADDDGDDDDDDGEEGSGVLDPAPTVCLVCADSPATRALWPHAFAVSYTISLMATDDFPREGEEEEQEERERREEEKKKRAAAAEAAAAAAAASARAEGGAGGGEASAPSSSAGKFSSSGGSSTPAGAAREAAAAAREAAARDVALLPGAGGPAAPLVLPHDFPEFSPADDPEGALEGMPREEPPPPPPPPVQLRLVMEVVNPLAGREEGGKRRGKGRAKRKEQGEEEGEEEEEEGEEEEEEAGDGGGGGGDKEQERGAGSKDLVFGAAVSAAVALRHAPLAEVRGGAGRVTLESGRGGQDGFSRAPALGLAPEEPLSLAGSRDIECVWVGGRVLSSSRGGRGSAEAAAAAAASSSASSADAAAPPRGSTHSPDSVVLGTGDYRHEIELIPRAGFRDTGVRAPRPKPRRRIPGVAVSRSAVDDAYAAALASGSAFAYYPKAGGIGLGGEGRDGDDPNMGPTAGAAGADVDSSGGAKTLDERAVAVGLIGEIARPVTLKPGQVFRGEAVIRVHDLSYLPGAEEDAALAHGLASRPFYPSRIVEEPPPEGQEPILGAEDEDIMVVDASP